jgi:hypothetical protein
VPGAELACIKVIAACYWIAIATSWTPLASSRIKVLLAVIFATTR